MSYLISWGRLGKINLVKSDIYLAVWNCYVAAEVELRAISYD